MLQQLEKRLQEKISLESELLKRAIAEGMAGIPYAMSKVDAQINKEQTAREAAEQQLAARLVAECSRVDREVQLKIDDVGSVLKKVDAHLEGQTIAMNQIEDRVMQAMEVPHSIHREIEIAGRE